MTDKDEIRDTALDYFEGWYDGDVDRVDRALHPELVKRWAGDDSGRALGAQRDKTFMVERTREGEGREDRTNDPIEVGVADVYGDIASAVVRSHQYREYLHLVRTQGGWRIVNAFWCYTDAAAESEERP